MFGFDDPEYLRSALEDERKKNASTVDALNARIDRLTGVLGDLFLLIEPAAGRFDWEGQQTEYYARGSEAKLMEQAKRGRDACVVVRDQIVSELAHLGLKPQDVGAAARSRREAEERRRRAAALRAEADRLDRGEK